MKKVSGTPPPILKSLSDEEENNQLRDQILKRELEALATKKNFRDKLDFSLHLVSCYLKPVG